MNTIFSCETFVNIYHVIRRHTPDNCNLCIRLRERSKFRCAYVNTVTRMSDYRRGLDR
jgi:hypothetical protein